MSHITLPNTLMAAHPAGDELCVSVVENDTAQTCRWAEANGTQRSVWHHWQARNGCHNGDVFCDANGEGHHYQVVYARGCLMIHSGHVSQMWRRIALKSEIAARKLDPIALDYNDFAALEWLGGFGQKNPSVHTVTFV